MSFKQSLGLIVAAMAVIAGLLFGFGFRFWWPSDPDPSTLPPKVMGSISNPNPPQPITTCVSYGLKQAAFSIDVPLKQSCTTVYK